MMEIVKGRLNTKRQSKKACKAGKPVSAQGKECSGSPMKEKRGKIGIERARANTHQ